MRSGLFIIATMLMGAVASAQPFKLPQSATIQFPTPPGTYQQSCIDIVYDRTGLSASCRKPTGKMQRNTGIQVSRCAPGADIFNLDGAIHCPAPAGTMGIGMVLPWGSYIRSCDGPDTWVDQDGYQLHARCQNRAGKWRYSLLDLRACNLKEDIVNNDGLVTCAPSIMGPVRSSTGAAIAAGH